MYPIKTVIIICKLNLTLNEYESHNDGSFRLDCVIFRLFVRFTQNASLSYFIVLSGSGVTPVNSQVNDFPTSLCYWASVSGMFISVYTADTTFSYIFCTDCNTSQHILL